MASRASIKINLLASWLSHGVALVVGFFLMPYVLHTLGDRNYGTWIFINSIAGYAGLMYLGFGDTISRYVAAHRANGDWNRLNQIVNVVFVVYLTMGACALSAAGVLAWQAERWHVEAGVSLLELRLVILVLGVNVAAGMLGSVFGGILQGAQRFDLLSSMGIAVDLLRAGLTWVLLQQQWGLLTLSLIFLAITLIENGFYVMAARKCIPELRFGVKYLKWETLRESFGFSAFAFLGAVASQVIYATDTVVIGAVLGAEAIVPYFIALRLCQYIRKPIEQVGSICMPRAGELHSRSDASALWRLLTESAGLTFVLTAGLLIGTAFFGTSLLQLWVGPGYDESWALLLILLGSQIVALPMGTVRSILFGMGHVRVPAILHVVEAAANLGLSLLLIKPWGLLGVALGTAVPVVAVELGILLPYVCRTLSSRYRSAVFMIFGQGAIPLAALAAYSLWVRSNFGVPGDWKSLVAVTCGGGTILMGTWFLLKRLKDRDSAATGRTESLLVEAGKE